MSFFKSSNPTLNEKIFEQSAQVPHTNAMTIQGTVNKFGVLFLLCFASAGFAWKMYASGVKIDTYMWIGLAVALLMGFVMRFRPQSAPIIAPLYALVMGFVVGGLSVYYNYRFEKIAPNLVSQSVMLTFAVVIAMYMLYKFRIIQATPTFRSIVTTATVGIMIFYLIAIGLRWILKIEIPFLHEGSALGIGFSLFVVGLAALNLILNFDMIEQGSKMGAPKYMEWYGAFGLMVVIIWLYLEILQLLAKIAGRK